MSNSAANVGRGHIFESPRLPDSGRGHKRVEAAKRPITSANKSPTCRSSATSAAKAAASFPWARSSSAVSWAASAEWWKCRAMCNHAGPCACATALPTRRFPVPVTSATFINDFGRLQRRLRILLGFRDYLRGDEFRHWNSVFCVCFGFSICGFRFYSFLSIFFNSSKYSLSAFFQSGIAGPPRR